MRLSRTVLGFSSEQTPSESEVQRGRVEAARRAGWQEIPAERLRPRGRPGWLVDAETDRLYRLYRGMTFEQGSARLLADSQPHLVFYVDEGGSPIVLEPLGKTWSEIIDRQARGSQPRRRSRSRSES